MRLKFTLFKLMVGTLLTALAVTANAQAPTPFQGPSDATTAPPTTASAVGQVLCNGSQVTLKGPADNTGTLKYQWYKVDNTGAKQLVKQGTNNDNVYTETSTAAGYYTYQLVILNSNSCTSDPSDLFNIYVLPALSASINASNASVCEKAQTNSVLTIQGLDSRFTYTYQWTRNTVDITGANSNTYTVAEQTAGTLSFGVKIAYALNAACSQTPTKSITVVPVPAKPVIQFGN